MVLSVSAMSGCSSPNQFTKGGAFSLSLPDDEQKVEGIFSTPKRLAVVIGINEFKDVKWNKLRYAVKDAEDMASVLSDQRYGQFDKVLLLTGPEQTTKQHILSAVQQLARENFSDKDTVIFYISSHGTISRVNDGKLHQYVVAYDTSFNDIQSTAIDLNDLRSSFSGLNSQKKALIFAFCHSGRGKSQLSENLMAELGQIKSPFFVKPIETASEATFVFAASAWGETAREDNRLENDIYTHFLVEGIKKHDRNGDGAITITEAHDYAKEQTYYMTNGEQRPSMESIILGSDPIVLSGEIVRTGKPIIYDYSNRFENMVVFVDGEKKGTLPVGIAIDTGVHTVELRNFDGTSPVFQEKISVKNGDQILLPILLSGYDHGTSFRLGYQGFLTEEVDSGVARPMMVFGISYADHAYFSPRWGYRADISYGQDEQTLKINTANTLADVTQADLGLSFMYRYPLGRTTLYAGPRVGGLYIARELATGNTSREDDASLTAGGIFGIHFRYKEKVSLAVEGAINHATVELVDTNTNSFYYNLFGGLSVNF